MNFNFRKIKAVKPVSFAKQVDENLHDIIRDLADSDLAIRTAAAHSAKILIAKRQINDKVAALGLWKGLFVSAWMCDKEVNQLALNGLLCGLFRASLVEEAQFVLLCGAFWETLFREWPGLDKHRLDKFMRLVREVLTQQLSDLRRLGFPKTTTSAVLSFITEGFPRSVGLATHVLGIYLGCLGVATRGTKYDVLSGELTVMLLDPIIAVVVSKSRPNPVVLGAAREAITDGLQDSPFALAPTAPERRRGSDDGDDHVYGKEILPPSMDPKVDWRAVVAEFGRLAASEGITQRIRTLLYDIKTKMAKTIRARERELRQEEKEKDVVVEEEEEVQEEEVQVEKPSKGKKSKRKREEEQEEEVVQEVTERPKKPKKKKERA